MSLRSTCAHSQIPSGCSSLFYLPFKESLAEWRFVTCEPSALPRPNPNTAWLPALLEIPLPIGTHLLQFRDSSKVASPSAKKHQEFRYGTHRLGVIANTTSRC